ncbi:hypothetical protein KIPB_013933, partial [Kipferlia bialata]
VRARLLKGQRDVPVSIGSRVGLDSEILGVVSHERVLASVLQLVVHLTAQESVVQNALFGSQAIIGSNSILYQTVYPAVTSALIPLMRTLARLDMLTQCICLAVVRDVQAQAQGVPMQGDTRVPARERGGLGVAYEALALLFESLSQSLVQSIGRYVKTHSDSIAAQRQDNTINTFVTPPTPGKDGRREREREAERERQREAQRERERAAHTVVPSVCTVRVASVVSLLLSLSEYGDEYAK